jgi:adenylate kinase
MRIILIGSPGAGKGTQAQFIANHFKITKIATGDMLRAAVQSGTPLGHKAKTIMDSGDLVPDDVMIALVKQRISEPDCKNGFLLDGFPRTIPQAEALRNAGISIDHVLEIHVDDEEIVHRLSGRWFHPPSGRSYHIDYHPPKNPGRDDETGQLLIQREDDKEETVRKRLSIYHEQTKPLIAYYSRLAINGEPNAPHYVCIDGLGEVNEVRSRILSALTS